MSLGVTIGKFYPFHLGHDHLIRQAKRQVDHLVILVGHHPDQEISGDVRAAWIQELHPEVEVLLALEDIPETPESWAKRTLELLGGRRPDVAFTSESYGTPWARAMGASHLFVDPDRRRFPISGTRLRQDLAANWSMLTSPARAYFAKRISVLGVESSGTTTLARALAAYYQTVWVPEYGRWYWEGRRYTPDAASWEEREFLRIAEGQLRWEEDLARRANKLVICDTDPLATYVWHRRYLGSESAALEHMAYANTYDLTILTDADFDLVQDGTRESEHVRMDMHAWFQSALEASQRPYIVVQGPHEVRVTTAIGMIDSKLSFSTLKLNCHHFSQL